MTEAIAITRGFRVKHFDPVADILDAAAQPPESAQDPAVVARCGDVLREAATLCLRYKEEIVEGEAKDLKTTLCTPEVTYRTATGAEGSLWLAASFRSRVGELALDWSASDVALMCWGPSMPELLGLMFVKEDGVRMQTGVGMRAGGHAELNYFQDIVRRIREGAFPKADDARRSIGPHSAFAARLKQMVQEARSELD